MLISSSLLLLIDVAIIFSMYFFCWNDSSLMLLSRNEMNSSGSTDILIVPFIALYLIVSVCVSTLCCMQVSFPCTQGRCGISHVASCRSSSCLPKVCWRVATSDIPHDTRDALPSIAFDIPLLPYSYFLWFEKFSFSLPFQNVSKIIFLCRFVSQR